HQLCPLRNTTSNNRFSIARRRSSLLRTVPNNRLLPKESNASKLKKTMMRKLSSPEKSQQHGSSAGQNGWKKSSAADTIYVHPFTSGLNVGDILPPPSPVENLRPEMLITRTQTCENDIRV